MNDNNDNLNGLNANFNSFDNEWKKTIESLDSGHHFDNISPTLIDEYINKQRCLVYEIWNNIDNNKYSHILEIGFGRGLIATYLSYKNNIEIFGIEKNPGYVKLALATSDHFYGNLKKDNFILEDASSIDLEKFTNRYLALKNKPANKRFDIVFSQGLFHHFDNDKIKKYIDKYLEISPVIIFSVPSHRHPYNDGIPERPTPYFNEDEIERFLTINEWKEILKDYNVESIFYYDHSTDDSSEIIKDISICTTVRRKQKT